MTQDDINREESANPANWGDGPCGLYFSKRDSRLWVPKRAEATSWTLNFGHRNAAQCTTRWLLMFTFLQALLVSVATFIEVRLGARGVLGFIGVVSVPLLFTFLAWIAIARGPVASKKDRGKDG